jgi:hypothetical protein
MKVIIKLVLVIFVFLSLHIRVFAKNGEFIKTIGRKGHGTGETQSPRYIQITPQERMSAWFSYRRKK